MKKLKLRESRVTQLMSDGIQSQAEVFGGAQRISFSTRLDSTALRMESEACAMRRGKGECGRTQVQRFTHPTFILRPRITLMAQDLIPLIKWG